MSRQTAAAKKAEAKKAETEAKKVEAEEIAETKKAEEIAEAKKVEAEEIAETKKAEEIAEAKKAEEARTTTALTPVATAFQTYNDAIMSGKTITTDDGGKLQNILFVTLKRELNSKDSKRYKQAIKDLKEAMNKFEKASLNEKAVFSFTLGWKNNRDYEAFCGLLFLFGKVKGKNAKINKATIDRSAIAGQLTNLGEEAVTRVITTFWN